MNSKLTKILALVLALVLALGVFAGCSKKAEEKPAEEPAPTTEPETKPEEQPEAPAEPVYEDVDLADAVTHTDYTSVYETIGSKVTIDMVTEDPDTGLATIEYEGVTYEAGMDFLSMAMVYNCQPAGEYETAEEVFNQWWKLYIQRWNYLACEVPLYANQYFDFRCQRFKV